MLVPAIFQLFDCNYTLYKTDTSAQEAVEKPLSNPHAPWPGMAHSGAANEAGARGGVTRTSLVNTAGWRMAFGGMRQRYV